jgi:hypothetical protein
MERKFYTNDFEQLLKEKTADFRMYPSKRVWHSIYNEMHPGRRWPSIAVSLLLLFTLLVVGYWNGNIPSQKITAALIAPPNNLNTTAIAPGNTSNNFSNNLLYPTQGKNVQSFGYIFLGATPPANTQGIGTAIAWNENTQLFIINPNSNVAQNNTKIKSSTAAAPPFYGKSIFVNKTEYGAKEIMLQNTGTDGALIAPVANLKNNQPANAATDLNVVANNSIDEKLANETSNALYLDAPALNRVKITALIAGNKISTSTINIKDNNAVKVNVAADKKIISTEDKVWMEDYAFYQKSKRKKWYDRAASEIYFTPSVGYRNFSNNYSSFDLNTVNSFAGSPITGSIEDAVNQNPGLGLELGAGLVYSAAKNIRLKIGVQANYTSYIVNANQTNHPILTTLMLNDLNSGYPYMESRPSTLSNIFGYKTSKIPNTTYQLSLPVGFALKLAGNSNLEWYAGATLQPTFIFGGNANLISFDRKSYVKDPSMIRQWNLNSGLEIYIHYKFAGSTLQIGPQFRYQLGSTYSKKFTLNENLYNVGVKVGVLKNF